MTTFLLNKLLNKISPLWTAKTPAADNPHHLAQGWENDTVKLAVLYWNHGNQEPDTSLRRATLEIVYMNSFVFAHLWYPFCPNLNVMFHHGMKVSHISLKCLHWAIVFILMFHWLCFNVAVKYCKKTSPEDFQGSKHHNSNGVSSLKKKHTFCTGLTLQQVCRNDWPCKFLTEWAAEKY